MLICCCKCNANAVFSDQTVISIMFPSGSAITLS